MFDRMSERLCDRLKCFAGIIVHKLAKNLIGNSTKKSARRGSWNPQPGRAHQLPTQAHHLQTLHRPAAAHALSAARQCVHVTSRQHVRLTCMCGWPMFIMHDCRLGLPRQCARRSSARLCVPRQCRLGSRKLLLLRFFWVSKAMTGMLWFLVE